MGCRDELVRGGKSIGKKLAKRAAIGVAVGVALEHIAALITSIARHLGYYAACLVSLPERVGGEINAVLWQMGRWALLGGVVGGCSAFLGAKQWPVGLRLLAFLGPVAACALGIFFFLR